MLKVWVKGYREDCIKDINQAFDSYYSKDWLVDNTIVKILQAVDAVVISDGKLCSATMGVIDAQYLSTECKSIMLMYKLENKNINASYCGNNHTNLIVELSKEKDITITLHHLMEFKEDFSGIFLDTGEVFNNRQEYVLGMCKLIGVIK